MAAIGDTLLQNNRIHIFAQSTYDVGGAAPIRGATVSPGGAAGPNSWMPFSAREFLWTDSAHHSPVNPPNYPYPVDVQEELAHELDHLIGNVHITTNGSLNKWLTPNAITCSDLQFNP